MVKIQLLSEILRPGMIDRISGIDFVVIGKKCSYE